MVSQIRTALRDTSFDDVRKQVDGVLEKAGEIQGRAHQRRSAARATTATTWDGRPKVAWPARVS
jgi:hypothetical protein